MITGALGGVNVASRESRHVRVWLSAQRPHDPTGSGSLRAEAGSGRAESVVRYSEPRSEDRTPKTVRQRPNTERPMPRILIAECKQEVSSFNPVPSGYEDFVMTRG